MKNPKPRKTWLALLLTVLAPGVGHIYCGRARKGLWIYGIYVLSALVLVGVFAAVAHLGPSITGLYALLTMYGLGIIVVLGFIYVVIDSIVAASRAKKRFIPGRLNRWYVYLLLIALCWSIGPDTFQLIRAYRIPSSSNEPSLIIGDRVFVNMKVYRKETPKKGDMIVFIYPLDAAKDYVKRVIALPGETIEIREYEVLVNGNKLPRERVVRDLEPESLDKQGSGVYREKNVKAGYLVSIAPYMKSGGTIAKTLVPEGHYYVLGDNRSFSADSRFYGPIPRESIRGRLDYIYWPADRFGVFEPHNWK